MQKATFTPIPREKLEIYINKPIHLSWANKGCVWILEKIEGETMHLVTPKTRKKITASTNNAVYVRRFEDGHLEG